MKLLYILNTTNRVNAFCMSALLAAKALGIEFHIAGNWRYENEAQMREDEKRLGIRIYQIDFERFPLHPKNLGAIKQLQKIARAEGFDLIHCNTPTGGLAGRVLGLGMKGTRVLYQAHGFHFYQGAPFLNWALYYPFEKLMARLTDTLVCINREDYDFALSRLKPRRGGKVLYIPGVGVDTGRFQGDEARGAHKRAELGLPQNAFTVLMAGELNENKNHLTGFLALKQVPQAHLLLAGRGPLEARLKEEAQSLGIADRVHFLGFRTDLAEIYQASDLFCLPSFREGLCTALMEAMATGLPAVASDIRGNRDLVIPGKGGSLIKPTDTAGFGEAIRSLYEDAEKRKGMGRFNRERVKAFSLEAVTGQLKALYQAESAIVGKRRTENAD